MAREGVPLIVIQRQLGHTNLTSIYLQDIDNTEIIDTVHARRAPIVPSTARSGANAATGGRGAGDFPATDPRPDRQPGTRWRAARRTLHSSRRSDACGVSGLLRSRKEHSRSDMAQLRKQ